MCIARVEVREMTTQGSKTNIYNANLDDSDIWADIRVLFVGPAFNGYIIVSGVGFRHVVNGQYTSLNDK